MIKRIFDLQPIGAMEETITVFVLLGIVWAAVYIGWILANVALRIRFKK